MKTKYNPLHILIYAVISVSSAFFTIRLSYLVGEIIHRLVQGTLLNDLPSFALFILGIMLCYILTGTLKDTAGAYLLGTQSARLRQSLTGAILRQKRAEYVDKGASYYHNLLYTDVETLRDSYFQPRILILDGVVLLAFAAGSILSIHWSFLLIALIATFIPNIIPSVFASTLKFRREKASETSESFLRYVKESVLGMRVIRDFAIEETKRRGFEESSDQRLDAGTKLVVTQQAITASFIFTGYFMYAFVLACGVFLYLKGQITIADIMIASQLTNNIKSPILSIINNRSKIRSTETIRQKMDSVLAVKPSSATAIPEEVSDIQISHLSFCFPNGKKVLDDVNVTLSAGKKYLLIGESGAGKSTFLRILDKQYADYQGSIVAAHTELKDIVPGQWHKQVLYLSQDVYLFEKTLAFNIALEEQIDTERMAAAIRIARLTDFVAKLEQGMDTIIKESATNISGGEKKRIGLARVLYRDPKIILLDEPFSALDDANRQALEEDLLGLKDKMILHIAHQYDEETRKKYDAVLVFRNQNITWEELPTGEKEGGLTDESRK